MSAAVPTIWFMLLQHLEANPHITLPDLSRVAIGGSACPEALMRTFHDEYHVNVIHALDMTETSPLGAICKPKGSLSHLSEEDLWNQRVKQGRALFGIEMKLTDDEDKALDHDGKAFGHLKVKGPWIA